MLRPLTVGEILDTSFTLCRRHFGPLATVALVCTGVPLVLRLFLEASGGFFENIILGLLYALALVVLNLVASAATVFIVSVLRARARKAQRRRRALSRLR